MNGDRHMRQGPQGPPRARAGQGAGLKRPHSRQGGGVHLIKLREKQQLQMLKQQQQQQQPQRMGRGQSHAEFMSRMRGGGPPLPPPPRGMPVPPMMSGGGGGGRHYRPMTSQSQLQRQRQSNRTNYNNGGSLVVTHIPYQITRDQFEDLVKQKVGKHVHVEWFTFKKHPKHAGKAVIRCPNKQFMPKVISELDGFPLLGLSLTVQENPDLINKMMANVRENKQPANNEGSANGETYGLNLDFLKSHGIHLPLTNRVFVSNLDYNVDEPKMREVFKIAGKVKNVELPIDIDGKSKGYGYLEYDHPVEAVQAITMLNQQTLFNRKMVVKMDGLCMDKESNLPRGLSGLGPGLGSHGEPLKNISKVLSGPKPGPSGSRPPAKLSASLSNIHKNLSRSMGGSRQSLNNFAPPLMGDFQDFNNGMDGDFKRPRGGPQFNPPNRNSQGACMILVTGLSPYITRENLIVRFREVENLIDVNKVDDYTALVSYREQDSAIRATRCFNESSIKGSIINVKLF